MENSKFWVLILDTKKTAEKPSPKEQEPNKNTAVKKSSFTEGWLFSHFFVNVQGSHLSGDFCNREPEFLKFYGAQKSIPSNQFCQPV